MENQRVLFLLIAVAPYISASKPCSTASAAQTKTDMATAVEKTTAAQKTREEYEKLYPQMAHFTGFADQSKISFFENFYSNPDEDIIERAKRLNVNPYELIKKQAFDSLIYALRIPPYALDAYTKPTINTLHEAQAFVNNELTIIFNDKYIKSFKQDIQDAISINFIRYPLLDVSIHCNGKKLYFWQAWESAVTNADKSVALECLLDTLNASKKKVDLSIIRNVNGLLKQQKFLPHIQKDLQNKLSEFVLSQKKILSDDNERSYLNKPIISDDNERSYLINSIIKEQSQKSTP